MSVGSPVWEGGGSAGKKASTLGALGGSSSIIMQNFHIEDIFNTF